MPKKDMPKKDTPKKDTPKKDTPKKEVLAEEIKTVSIEEKKWATILHLTFFLGASILPIIIWVLKKDEMPFVNKHGKAFLNFQISLIIYLLISFVLILIGIGFVLIPSFFIFSFVVTIMAAVKANKGELFNYPLTIKFIE